MITADTITEEQIRELWNRGAISWDTMKEARGDFGSEVAVRSARARCAEILSDLTARVREQP